MGPRWAGVIVAVGGFCPAATAAVQDPPIVLWSPASARFAGLNGAGAALVGHAGTVFTNPAGLATIRHIGLEVSYEDPAVDAYLVSGAMGWRLGQLDLGIGLRHFDLTTDPLAPPPGGARVGSDSSRQLLAVGSLVYRFPLVAVGLSLKQVRRWETDLIDEGLTVDVGAAIAIFDLMALGFSVQQIGGNWNAASSIPILRLSRLGFTMNYVDPQETLRLMSTIEMQWEAERGSRFVLGVETGVVLGGDAGLVGRIGYASRPYTPAAGSRFSYGLTLELTLGKVDVAYQPNTATGEAVKRIGFRFAF
jgi:hypothetical protein